MISLGIVFHVTPRISTDSQCHPRVPSAFEHIYLSSYCYNISGTSEIISIPIRYKLPAKQSISFCQPPSCRCESLQTPRKSVSIRYLTILHMSSSSLLLCLVLIVLPQTQPSRHWQNVELLKMVYSGALFFFFWAKYLFLQLLTLENVLTLHDEPCDFLVHSA